MSNPAVPDKFKYTREHEWLLDNGDGTATVGVTDFAQGELGDIVFVELEQPGFTMKQNDTFGTIEAVKTVSDLFAPVTGEIIEINDELESDPERVNEDPFGDGWLIKIKLENPDEINQLLTADDYKGIID